MNGMDHINKSCFVKKIRFLPLNLSRKALTFSSLNRNLKKIGVKKLTKNIRLTDILQMYTKYLVNVLKFTKYSVNSYHQKGVKHYILTN